MTPYMALFDDVPADEAISMAERLFKIMANKPEFMAGVKEPLLGLLASDKLTPEQHERLKALCDKHYPNG